jgi:hypothetical protein
MFWFCRCHVFSLAQVELRINGGKQQAELCGTFSEACSYGGWSEPYVEQLRPRGRQR